MAFVSLKKFAFYSRPDIPEGNAWQKKLSALIKRKRRDSRVIPVESLTGKNGLSRPDLLIILGGDGTIQEAIQKFHHLNPLFFGLNLGHVGFLASVRERRNFVKGLSAVIEGKYNVVARMLMSASVLRNGRKIFSEHALGDVAIQNLLGMVDIGVSVDRHPVQHIHGTGVLVSTATGSTAYNLSAHGPIVMPDIKCLIITELLDHNIPTPSLVIKRNRTISLKIEGFRKKDQFIIRKMNERADVVLATDGEKMIALEKGDEVVIKRSGRLVRFAELEKNYFFKSLQEKFAFR